MGGNALDHDWSAEGLPDKLEPWTHFIPVAADFTDLEERLMWVLDDANADETKQIADNARAFADKYLTYDNAVTALAKTLETASASRSIDWHKLRDMKNAARQVASNRVVTVNTSRPIQNASAPVVTATDSEDDEGDDDDDDDDDNATTPLALKAAQAHEDDANAASGTTPLTRPLHFIAGQARDDSGKAVAATTPPALKAGQAHDDDDSAAPGTTPQATDAAQDHDDDDSAAPAAPLALKAGQAQDDESDTTGGAGQAHVADDDNQSDDDDDDDR